MGELPNKPILNRPRAPNWGVGQKSVTTDWAHHYGRRVAWSLLWLWVTWQRHNLWRCQVTGYFFVKWDVLYFAPKTADYDSPVPPKWSHFYLGPINQFKQHVAPLNLAYCILVYLYCIPCIAVPFRDIAHFVQFWGHMKRFHGNHCHSNQEMSVFWKCKPQLSSQQYFFPYLTLFSILVYN